MRVKIEPKITTEEQVRSTAFYFHLCQQSHVENFKKTCKNIELMSSIPRKYMNYNLWFVIDAVNVAKEDLSGEKNDDCYGDEYLTNDEIRKFDIYTWLAENLTREDLKEIGSELLSCFEDEELALSDVLLITSIAYRDQMEHFQKCQEELDRHEKEHGPT